MSDETPTPESEDTGKAPGRSQAPAHVPPHLQSLFTKHEGAVADRPGFRNKANARTKKQKRPKKAKK